MSQLPGRMLRDGLLLLSDDDIYKIVKWEPSLPGNVVTLDLRHQITGEESVRSVRWDERVYVEQGLTKELAGAHGKAGSLTVELAGFDDNDGENRLLYRYEIRDATGELLEDGHDIRSAAHAKHNNDKMMSTLVSFLGAAADAYETIHAGRESENGDLFAPRTMQWASENVDSLVELSMDLNPEEWKGLTG